MRRRQGKIYMSSFRTAVSLGLAAFVLSAAGCRKTVITGGPANVGQPKQDASPQAAVSPELKTSLEAITASNKAIADSNRRIAEELATTRRDIEKLKNNAAANAAAQSLERIESGRTEPGDGQLPPPSSAGVVARQLHTLDDYIPCLFSEENTAFFRGKQISQTLKNAVMQELQIQV
jgi:hypothetical protein